MAVPRGLSKGALIQLGKLTIGDQLGRGGFGVVHKATLDGIQMPFAIKLLQPSPFNEDLEGAAKRFLREAEILFTFRHPHIVPIYGVGEHEGRPYILMELFRGYNLAEVRAKFGQPAPEAVLAFIERVAGALDYAHARDVVHRDIKPENLMTRRGDARVLDFGVAGWLDPLGTRFTPTADAVAGDAYSAPELADNPKLVDARCDLYSLGACWYFLLTGMSPRGLNWESNLRRSVQTMTPAYEQVVLRCLEQPERRYQTAAELVVDVQRLRAGDNPVPSTHDLNDEEARILGVVIRACPTDTETISFFKIEQEVADRQPRLRSSVAMRALVNRKMVESWRDQDDFGNQFTNYRPTDAGFEWVERHISRLDELLKPLPAPSFDNEIPF